MTDPFDALYTPTGPVDPDPAFASALRARIERALLDPLESTMSTTVTTTATTTGTTRTTSATRADAAALRLHAVTPYLAVVDSRAAVAFYETAFSAVRRDEPIVMPDGRVGHVEVALGDSVLMMADEFPEMGLVAPVNRGGVSQSLRLEVADPDAVVARAVAAGGTLERPVTDSPYGRGGTVVDPSGHRWMVSRETPVARAGDVVYASIWTPDVERAARFYGDVLGWTTTAGSGPQGRHVTNSGDRLGLWGGQTRPTTMLCLAVPDVDAAVELVRAAGGTAGDPTDEPYGRLADCADDQGVPFALASGSAPPGPAEPGGLSYAELRVPDATRARAFWSTVLGWRFQPGAEPGYWHPTSDGAPTRPWTGLSGGHPEPVVVPTYTVGDIAAATEAVRAAGGDAGDPSAGPSGLTADCTDDQGARFSLQQP